MASHNHTINMESPHFLDPCLALQSLIRLLVIVLKLSLASARQGRIRLLIVMSNKLTLASAHSPHILLERPRISSDF